jgi:hypothetical protein
MREMRVTYCVVSWICGTFWLRMMAAQLRARVL